MCCLQQGILARAQSRKWILRFGCWTLAGAPVTENLSQAKLTLARELVDDVELSRLAPEQLLLKALRLARLLDDGRAARWLGYELNGYPNTDAGKSWMNHFGRMTNQEKSLGYWMPLAGITGTVASMQVQLQTLQVPALNFAPSSANPHELVAGFAGLTAQKVTEPAHKVLERLQTLTVAITSLSSIRSRVLAAVHDFAVKNYHELAYSGLAESIFETHRSQIDALLSTNAPDVPEKFPSVVDRLAAGDPEAVSQAMNSVRRMIKALADHVYPPGDQAITVDGQKYEIGTDKVLNRIKLYLLAKCPSQTRRDRLNRTLREIHERASAGSHSDITADEARSLFLQAYLVLGEILSATVPGPTPSTI